MAERETFSVGQLTANSIICADIYGVTKGKKFFVDPAGGSDGNTGDHPTRAYKTITKAYAQCVDGRGDIVYYLAGGTSITLTATLTWAKSYTHLIGVVAPTNIAQRARFFETALGVFTPMINVTGSGCIFKDLYFFQGVASTAALVCFQVTGGRNYFENVHFAGIGHATGQGDVVGARSLLLAGAEENTFVDCTIGVDTIARSVANAELEFTTQARRNIFKDCRFLSFADADTHLFIKADAAASAIDRFALFENCLFYNAIDSTATAMTEAAAIHSSLSGMLIMRNCSLIGATDWEAATVSGKMYIDGAAPTAASSGLMVAVAA